MPLLQHLALRRLTTASSRCAAALSPVRLKIKPRFLSLVAYSDDDDTIYGVSSGAGRAGVAVIRVSGPNTRAVISCLLGCKLPDSRADDNISSSQDFSLSPASAAVASFREFRAEYGKCYASEDETLTRFSHFCDSLRRIRAQNLCAKSSRSDTSRDVCTFAINEYADLSPAEFAATRLGLQHAQYSVGAASPVAGGGRRQFQGNGGGEKKTAVKPQLFPKPRMYVELVFVTRFLLPRHIESIPPPSMLITGRAFVGCTGRSRILH